MVGFEMVRVESVGMELTGSRRVETELVVFVQAHVLPSVRWALVHQQPLGKQLFWGVEGSQCGQELGLSESVVRQG